MKLGAVNDVRKDICDEIKFIADSGFNFIDLTLEPTFSDKINIKEVKKTIKKTWVEVVGHTSPFLPLGCGMINWNNTVSILKKYGYNSTITLEIFSNDRSYLLYSKKFLEEILDKEWFL